MGSFYSGLPIPAVLEIIRKENINTFIETGTFHGDSALWASNFFQEVYTVEASRILYDKYHDKLSRKHIKHIYGDSPKILSKLIESSEPKRLVWLDAHWVGDQFTFGQANEVPVIEELQSIPKGSGDNLIMIDDARYFLSPSIPPLHDYKKWPNIGEIFLLLNEIQNTKTIFIFNDVIISPPPSMVDLIGNILHKLYTDYGSKQRIVTVFKNFRNLLYDVIR